LITRIRQKLEYNYSKSVDKTRISLVSKFGMSKLVGADPSFTASINRLHKISKINAPVLIIGETGTGKELFARAIHYTSNREKKPYIPVNCGSIPVELFENELFGHIKGAYTDAKANQKGFIAEAEGGTLFLDEINSMPFAAQVKLLRFLQERQYKPLGSSKYVPADVRIIAASNINLMDAEITDKFRKDLLYRLSVFTIFVPPLRNRKSDIPILANYFLEKYSELYNLPQKTLSKKAIDKLISYNWPGNVRELENIIQQCLVESKTSIIDPDEILIRKGLNAAIDNNNSETDTKKNMFERFEKDYLKDLLIESKGNVSAAARKANISRNHFYRLMRKYNIGREDL
jgi:two-component system response regulator GlrR